MVIKKPETIFVTHYSYGDQYHHDSTVTGIYSSKDEALDKCSVYENVYEVELNKPIKLGKRIEK